MSGHRITDAPHSFLVMVRPDPLLFGSFRLDARNCTWRQLHLVMAALGAAIHVFGTVSNDVDGRDTPGHDDERAPVANTDLNPTEVGLTGPSFAASCCRIP
jgi:hypothetical protein